MFNSIFLSVNLQIQISQEKEKKLQTHGKKIQSTKKSMLFPNIYIFYVNVFFKYDLKKKNINKSSIVWLEFKYVLFLLSYWQVQ